MYNLVKIFSKRLCLTLGFVLLLSMDAEKTSAGMFTSVDIGATVKEAESALSTVSKDADISPRVPKDTLQVRIADSAYISPSDVTEHGSLQFKIQIRRLSADWERIDENPAKGVDTVLGDFDFYFTFNPKAFMNDEGVMAVPSIDILIDADWLGRTPRVNLLSMTTHFYGSRYAITGRANGGSGSLKYGIPRGDEWVDLCMVTIPFMDAMQNPRIFWDGTGKFNEDWTIDGPTGAMTAREVPIMLELSGNVGQNPNDTLGTSGLFVPTFQCQGDDLLLYIKDAVTSGTSDKGLTYKWKHKAVKDPSWSTTLGGASGFNASTPIADKTDTSPDGRYQFEILGDGDTLIIRNSPGIVDGMHFKCDISDESLFSEDGVQLPGISVDGYYIKDPLNPNMEIFCPAKVLLRDSLFGYFAKIMPSDEPKMNDQTDTIRKCISGGALLNIILFGPENNEMTRNEFGDTIYVCYAKRDDVHFNIEYDTVKIDVHEARERGQLVAVAASNPSSSDVIFIFKNLNIDHLGEMWVESIHTSSCNNGVGYALYDTVAIKSVEEGTIELLDLNPITVAVGESRDLDAYTSQEKDYTVELLKFKPASTSSVAIFRNEDKNWDQCHRYTAGSTVGVDTLIYKYSDINGCEFRQLVTVSGEEYSYLTMKVLLEGPYLGKVGVGGQDSMNCAYADEEFMGGMFFPRNDDPQHLISPYDQRCHLVGVNNINDVTTRGTICDWIYIQLYEAVMVGDGEYTLGGVIDSVSAFVLSDGEVIGTDGDVVKFAKKGNEKLFIKIKHRNHVVIFSNVIQLPMQVPVNSFVLDCTNVEEIFRGALVLMLVESTYCMIGGDISKDNYITVADEIILNSNFTFDQYDFDITGDKYVTGADLNFIKWNANKGYIQP